MTKVSHPDWVRLSAYLDGEVSQEERKQIENRIRSDPAFQSALDELLRAKQVLKAAPKLKVPRRFYLTPDQVGIKKRPHPARGYRLAAVAMTFIFYISGSLDTMDLDNLIKGVKDSLVRFPACAIPDDTIHFVPEYDHVAGVTCTNEQERTEIIMREIK